MACDEIIDIDEKFMLIIVREHGDFSYFMGHRYEFGLFQDYCAGADSDIEEAIEHIKLYGQQTLSDHDSTIRCFGLIREFLDESKSLSAGLDKLSKLARLHGYELYAEPLILDNSVCPVVFHQDDLAPKFKMFDGDEYYEFYFDLSYDFEKPPKIWDLKPYLSEFCINQLCKIYEADKTKTHLLKYRDSRLGSDLGL